MRTRRNTILLFIILIYLLYQGWLAQYWLSSPQPIHPLARPLIQDLTPVHNHRNERMEVLGQFKDIFDMGMSEVQEQRKSAIHTACNKNIKRYSNPITKYDIGQFMFTDARHRLMFCQIQKVGSSFMWDMMVKLNKSTTNVDQTLSGLSLLSNLKITKLADLYSLISNSFKIMFVREPYERLFAGYVDKMVSANTVYWNQFGSNIKRTLHKHYGKPKYQQCGNDVTFEDLIDYLIMSEKNDKLIRDSHFNPMYDHCSPCQVRYDYIGKMETFKQDILKIFDSWNNNYGTDIRFKDFSKESAMMTATNQIRRLYDFKDKWKQCISFYEALKREWRALQIRGVLPITVDFPFTEQQSLKLDWKTMLVTVKSIHEDVQDRNLLKRQKREAMIEAFSLVSKKTLARLREVFQPDCELFGYDDAPGFVFNNTRNQKQKLKYFDIFT